MRICHLLNFHKNIWMIGHVTDEVMINLKCWKYNNKPLKGNVNYTKSLTFLMIFMISFYSEELYSNTA